MSVDYATADGTAKAGEDFTAANGTLTFAAGETTKTVSVAVLDDAHDEGEETMKLLLSNATGGARIRDGEATGTIENSDPIPKAWLARFGRTVADQVLEAVQGRMAAPRVPGFQGQLAGHSLGGGGPRGDVLPGSEGERVPEELAEWIRGAADEDGSGALSFGGATRGDEFPGVQWQVPGVESRNVTERDPAGRQRVLADRRVGGRRIRRALGPRRDLVLRWARRRPLGRRRGAERDVRGRLDARAGHRRAGALALAGQRRLQLPRR